MGFFVWWYERPWWLRWGIALLPIVAGLIRLATGVIWLWAFAIGITLVLINLYDLVRKKKPEDTLPW